MKSQTVHAGPGMCETNPSLERPVGGVGWPLLWSCILLGAFLVLSPATGWGQRDNFDDGDDAGWYKYDPIAMTGYPGVGSWTFPGGNKYRIQTTVSPAPGTVGPGRAGSLRTDVTYTDFYMSVDIVDWGTNLNQAIGLVARMHDLGPGMSDGYALTYQVPDRNIDITRFTNEDPDGGELALDASDEITMVPGRSYRYIFFGVGPRLTARIYELPMGRFPIVDVTATDYAWTSGYCGMLNFDNSGGSGTTDATFDNYLALVSEPPTLDISYIAPFQELSVKWPTNDPTFILQTSPSLDEPDWTEIQGPYQVYGPPWYYYYTGEDVVVSPKKFFRLIKPQ